MGITVDEARELTNGVYKIDNNTKDKICSELFGLPPFPRRAVRHMKKLRAKHIKDESNAGI